MKLKSNLPVKTSTDTKLYKQYERINQPYFNISENIVLPLGVLLATMIITYFSLYFVSFPFTCFLYIVGSLFINLLFHGLKNFSPNGNNTNRTSFISLLSSYLIILFLLCFLNIGTYLLVKYQETNTFHATIFFIWLFIVLGIPLSYYLLKYANYYQLIRSQALAFTKVHIQINYDPEFLIQIEEFHFINSTKKKIAKFPLKNRKDLDSLNTIASLDISTRNNLLFSPVFSETLPIPVKTNLVQIGYYSISEDTFFQDEIPFPFDQLHFEENKYPINQSKILRGKKTEPLSITILEKGTIKIFTGSKLLVETSLKKDNLKTKNTSEYKEIIEPYQNRKVSSTLLLDNETRERIKTRQEIREKPFNWTLHLNLSHNHLICVYDCNNKESLRKRFTDLNIKQPILQTNLPKKILLYSDAFDRTKWLEIAIDTEKLYIILVQHNATTFEIFLTVNIEDATVTLNLKIEEQFIEFNSWKKNIHKESLLDIQKKIKEKKDRNYKNSLWNEINVLMQNKEFIQALEKCKKAIQENPEDGMLYFYEARLLFYMNGTEACFAKEDYFMKKTKNDTFAHAHMHNNFGCMLDQVLKYKEALSYFEKANELVPEMAIYVANKAEIHYKLKNRKEAISFAKEAQEKGDTSEIVKEILKNNGKTG